MQISNIMNRLNTFLDSENVSQVNRDIVDAYFMRLVADNLCESTLIYNVNIMKFILQSIKSDLNKLTETDVVAFQAALRRRDCAESTKKQYMIGFKRFLYWYSKNNLYSNRREYIELAGSAKMKFKPNQKNASDLLTGAEIMEMIRVANTPREAALIAVLYDSGCRIGELLSCKIKHVEFVGDECHLTFPKSKTITRSSLLIFAKGYLETYLKHHPAKDDREAPLFSTSKRYNVGTRDKPNRQYKPMTHDSILVKLKDIAVKAGVTKNVHPHLFRHTRATELSATTTEADLRNIFGWASGSTVPSRYVHLSGQDSANAMRKHYGLINVKKTIVGIEMGACLNCKELNPVTESFCVKCHMPLNKESKFVNATLNQALATYFAQHPDMHANLMKNILGSK